jgi:signal transduction histidine kinase
MGAGSGTLGVARGRCRRDAVGADTQPSDGGLGLPVLPARRTDAELCRRLRDEAERDVGRRLAATLHDGVGQTLQGLSLGLKHARQLAAEGEPVPTGLLDTLVGEVAEALHQVRAVSRELRPRFLDSLSLVEAVRVHADEMARRSGIDIRVHAGDAPCPVAERVKEQCFLAFREALSNALRHAGPSRVRVLLRVQGTDRLTLMVLDDGIGFDPCDPPGGARGLGLAMIRERAESMLGSARFRSRPGRGTAVRIRVPLHPEAAPCP